MGLNAAVGEGAPRLCTPRAPDVPAPDAPRSDLSRVTGTDRPRREDARRDRATRSRREEKDAEGAARGDVARDMDDIGTGASVPTRGRGSQSVHVCGKEAGACGCAPRDDAPGKVIYPTRRYTDTCTRVVPASRMRKVACVSQ